MAITQAMTTSCKVAMMSAEIDFSADTSQVFKMALYTSSATLDASTTAYSATNEVVGTGYTAGGATLTLAQSATSSGTTAFIDFTDPTWPSATITARGALIYLADGGTNPSVAVIDFGEDRITSGGNFTVNIPAPAAATAIIRIA